jgi:hypothetical protein
MVVYVIEFDLKLKLLLTDTGFGCKLIVANYYIITERDGRNVCVTELTLNLNYNKLLLTLTGFGYK